MNAKQCIIGSDRWRFCDDLHSLPGETCPTCSKAAARGHHPILL